MEAHRPITPETLEAVKVDAATAFEKAIAMVARTLQHGKRNYPTVGRTEEVQYHGFKGGGLTILVRVEVHREGG